LLNLLDERCGGMFDDIDAVIPAQERDEFMSRYRAAAGFAKDQLHAARPTIAPGAKVPLSSGSSAQCRARAATCQLESLQIPQSAPTK
jgi:hypothetical protein